VNNLAPLDGVHTMNTPIQTRPHAPVTFRQALRFWFWLGCVSFGGPAGQIALMHEELVVRRRWISEKRYLHALHYWPPMWAG
jgi:chromate transporter